MYDVGVNREVYDFYLKEVVEGDLLVCIYVMISVMDFDFKMLLVNGLIWDKDDFLFICLVKVYGDGVLGSCGVVLFLFYFDVFY